MDKPEKGSKIVPKIPFEVGDKAVFAKTLTETDLVLFAGITGDMNPPHINEQYMQTTPLKRRVAHGILVMGIACGTEYVILSHGPKAKALEESGLSYLSYGYDKVRFTRPVFINDTITATYEVVSVDDETMRSVGKLTAINQHGELVFVAEHILKYMPAKA